MSLESDIELLAKVERSLPDNPFLRRNYGAWAYRAMQARERLYAAVLDIYNGEVGRYVESVSAKESADQAAAKPGRLELRVLFSLINKWNTLYGSDPRRVFKYDGKRLEEDNKTNIVLQEEYRKAEINELMETADDYMRMTGVVATRPFFDAENDELVCHLYSANNVRVIPNLYNPARPKAVALVGTYQKEEGDGGATLEHQAEFFTDTSIGVVTGSKVKVDKLETVKMPIAFAWDKKPTNKVGFFVPCPGPCLAAFDRVLANDFSSPLGFTTILQGFGIPVTWGMKKGTSYRIGPDFGIDFDGDDPERKEDFEFKNPNAPLDEIASIIQRLIDWIREAYDIPKTMLDATMSPTGVAQVEAKAPLGLLREKRAKRFRPFENRLVKRIADVLIASGKLPGTLDPELFTVDMFYPEPKITKSTNDQIAKDKFDLDNKTTTRAALFMRDNPEQFDSEKDAEVFLKAKDEQEAVASDNLQGQALNGAQITAVKDILIGVSTGDIAPEAAIELISMGYPTMPQERVEKMIKAAAKNKVEKPEPQTGFPPQQKPGAVVPPEVKEK